nr:hypothetical protein [Lacticaseibacillus manihotivorans]
MQISELQPSLVKQFAAIIDRHQLGQAYVFSGVAGTGKAQLAEWIALRLFAKMCKMINLACNVLNASAS